MKIIFLDIDGVLNCEEWMVRRHKEVPQYSISSQYPFYEFDPILVQNLNRIVRETGAKVVVSSTWRHGRSVENLQKLLSDVGFHGEVIDKTMHLYINFERCGGYTIPRGCEIEAWLKKDSKFQRINWSQEKQAEYEAKMPVKNYVILDDDSDMLLGQAEHFVRTSWKDGLTAEKADKAIQILNSTLVELYYGMPHVVLQEGTDGH